MKNDEKWASGIANKLQYAANVGNQYEAWHSIKILSGGKQKTTPAVRDKNSDFITIQEKKRNSWKEYFEELLNPFIRAPS